MPVSRTDDYDHMPNDGIVQKIFSDLPELRFMVDFGCIAGDDVENRLPKE
jgi:hypothetical protein